ASHTDVATQSLTVNPSAASVSAAPNPALTGQVVAFDASASAIPLSAVTRFEWDLDGDGIFETNTGAFPSVSHVYRDRQIAHPSLRFTRLGGRVDVASTELDVRLAPPAGELGVSINSGDIATNNRNVRVTVVWPKLATDALFSNDGGFGPAGSTQLF